MPPPPTLLTRFHSTPPRFELSQARSLAWLSEAHALAEATREGLDHDARVAVEQRIARVLARCGCSPASIASRGVSVADAVPSSWDDKQLYDLHRHPHGRGTAARVRLFAEIVDDYFTATYADERVAPDELIHVTCTGYVSPSGAQRLVGRRGWGETTRVTHAYHMGCYAAVPAVRIGAGLLASRSHPHGQRVDVVHTELCSLHLDPADHRPEQLVVQSLFADGLIRYSLVHDAGAPGLRVLAVHEQIVPGTEDAMTWMVADWGMQMTLARDVPERIAAALRGFVLELYRRGGRELGRVHDSVFAVHPGGPKIIDRVRDVLELDEAHVAASRAVLFARGNMSSATLPHIWLRLLDDASVPAGTLIPSLAFGPGLTICGLLLEKR